MRDRDRLCSKVLRTRIVIRTLGRPQQVYIEPIPSPTEEKLSIYPSNTSSKTNQLLPQAIFTSSSTKIMQYRIALAVAPMLSIVAAQSSSLSGMNIPIFVDPGCDYGGDFTYFSLGSGYPSCTTNTFAGWSLP